jgi:hypothetical protein
VLAEALVLLAAAKEARDGEQLPVRDRDDVVVAEKEVELGGVQTLDGLVEDGKVKDSEEVPVLLVRVDLRTLALGDDVLDVEGMPTEAHGKSLCRLDVRSDDVDPGEAASGELVDERRRTNDDLTRATGP